MHQPTKSRTLLLDTLLPLLAAARPLCRQERTFVRLAVLTLGLLVALGRRTLSQVLVGLGAGEQPWAAWYRLFSAVRIDDAAAERQVLGDGYSGSWEGYLCEGNVFYDSQFTLALKRDAVTTHWHNETARPVN